MAWNDIPRTNSFSLGDFHDFDRCPFRFFVNHHLGKKYELAEGTPSQAVGSLLDLAIKKVHQSKAYGQPADYLVNFIKAAETDIKVDVAKRGKNSFYGSQVEFITPQLVEKTKEIFKNYCQGLNGKIKRMIPTTTLKGPKPFWKMVIETQQPLQLWGGPDSIEMGEDGVPEIVDYKYLEKGDQSTDYLDMDLMPKLYTLLCAGELQDLGHDKARFKIRLWHDPKNEGFYEEFNLSNIPNLKSFFQDKMERILRTSELSFCEKEYCKVCGHSQRQEWIKELEEGGWVKPSLNSLSNIQAASDLPF